VHEEVERDEAELLVVFDPLLAVCCDGDGDEQ
jgi:hypothetical protein